jgi:hypothetical protein
MHDRLVVFIAAAAAAVTLAACGDSVPPPPFANCGNGMVEPPEDCDLGALNNDNGACLTVCVQARCGDGFVWSGVEQCDTFNNNGQTCRTQGFDGGTLLCTACQFNYSECGPILTPTPTPPATSTPSTTPTPTTTPTPGEQCIPIAERRTVQVSYDRGGTQNASSLRFALQYNGNVVDLPTDGTVATRVSPLQSNTRLTNVSNIEDTLRARVVGNVGVTLAPGGIAQVVFNACSGAPPPANDDFACTVEECQPTSVQDCRCAATVQ